MKYTRYWKYIINLKLNNNFKYYHYIFITMMMQEFRQILNSPKASTSQILKQTQNMILASFEKMFPQSFNFSYLHEIYFEILGQNRLIIDQLNPISVEEQILLNHKLLDYFIQSIPGYLIDINTYNSLEQQTQKAEAIIRSHIKTQQQMKMYLEYLEAKVEKYQKIMTQTNKPSQNINRQIYLLISKEEILQRQKLNLLKKNQQLKLQVAYLSSQLQIQSNDTIVIQQNSSKENTGCKIVQGSDFSQRPTVQCEQISSRVKCQQISNHVKCSLSDMQKLKSLNSPSGMKDYNKDGTYLVPDYNNDITQKKKSHFWK